MKIEFNLKTLYTLILITILIGFLSFIIINQIEEFKLQDDPTLKELKEKITPLFKYKKYTGILSSINDRDILSEISFYKGDKSYTINKHKIFLCLRDEKGELYPEQQLIYVLLHELAHTICESIGHTDEFNKIFDALLLEAIKLGIYDSSFEIIQDYCQY
jgi:hypothetical protein